MQAVFVLALSEVKLTLKLFRTKIYLLLAVAVCVVFYVLVEWQYIVRADESASVGIMAPTYLAATLGPYFLALFCLAIVLLAYDLRERDLLSRINEVLEVVPASNVTVVFGRLLGLVLLLVVPVVVFVLAIILYGWIAEGVGLGYGNLIELHSTAAFLVWDLVPNLAFFGSLVIFLSTFIRSKATVVLIALTSLLVIFWLFLRLPLDVSSSLVTTTGATLFPSEIAPRFVSVEILLNRSALLFFTFGFVVLAGCCWQRPLTNRTRFAVVGICSCVFGSLIIGGSLFHQQLSQQEIQRWVRIHGALELSTFPDVIHIGGSVDIVPNHKVELDLTVKLIPPEDNIQDYVVLSFNPGYQIDKFWVDGNEIDDYSFNHGILRIPIHTRDGNAIPVRIKARGRPDARFAYLDAAVKTKDIAGAKVRNLFAMGTESFIFHPRFVVLTSGIKWYPTSGAATGGDELDTRSRDLFKVDLKVEVPEDWLVAGPGHRELVTTNDAKKSVYRIAPENPVPEMTVVSSKFERASTVVEGIEFEVLYTKHHQRRLRDLREIETSLKTRLSSFLVYWDNVGLLYPYERFSLVEVPTSLHIYAGGWNMDTVMGPPGLMLMRESSLPNSNVSIVGELNFDHNSKLFGHDESQRLQRSSAGTDLSSYFNSNVFGEHPTIGFTRNFVHYQTSITGPGAQELSQVLEDVAQRLIFDRSIFWDDRIDIYPSRAFIFEVALSNAKRSVYDLFDINRRKSRKSREELVLVRRGNQTEVWNDFEDYSLGKLTFSQAPRRSSRAVRMKSTALSQIMLKLLGRRSTATMLGHLVNTYRGIPFSYDDLVVTARKADLDLENVLGDSFTSKGLPGFILADPKIKRLPNSEYGKVFQASLIVHNAEPFDGFATVSWLHKGAGGGQREDTRKASKSFLVRGKKSVLLNVVSYSFPRPIDVVYVEPYLSLNREAIRIDIPENFDVDTIVDEPAQPYVVDISWSPFDSPEIIVDDLEPAFEIVYERPPLTTIPVISFVRDLIGTSLVEEWDQGMLLYVPERGVPPPKQRWLRRSDEKAYGKYRHTYAFVYKGKQDRSSYAKFTTSLPRSGRWRLDYHMPVESLDPNGAEARIQLVQGRSIDWYERYPPGLTEILIVNSEKRETKEFDAQAAEYGWNTIGVFDVDSSLTEVWISSVSDRKTIYADAIRWVPLTDK
ncbi:MAG: M1 family metallopeptidase [Gammaproteobacteria bacterium]|nr:M1 family metallopeptidase [Gammaproteobacteria bacterium]